MEFASAEYRVLESEGEVVAMVTRSGDIKNDSFVRCITLQVTSESNIDFEERPNINDSDVYFKPCKFWYILFLNIHCWKPSPLFCNLTNIHSNCLVKN